jgi:hypothetical protein
MSETDDWKSSLVAPEKDNRPQTEDVTATKGLSWEEFHLKVCKPSFCFWLLSALALLLAYSWRPYSCLSGLVAVSLLGK